MDKSHTLVRWHSGTCVHYYILFINYLGDPCILHVYILTFHCVHLQWHWLVGTSLLPTTTTTIQWSTHYKTIYAHTFAVPFSSLFAERRQKGIVQVQKLHVKTYAWSSFCPFLCSWVSRLPYHCPSLLRKKQRHSVYCAVYDVRSACDRRSVYSQLLATKRTYNSGSFRNCFKLGLLPSWLLAQLLFAVVLKHLGHVNTPFSS